jgi:cytosine/adenosine deaminase-related metal-dependent hydrolase
MGCAAAGRLGSGGRSVGRRRLRLGSGGRAGLPPRVRAGTLVLEGIGTLITMDDERREVPDAYIAIRDGVVQEVSSGRPGPEWEGATKVSCKGLVALPGLINTHHHLFQTVSRCLPACQDAGLDSWLATLYPIWSRTTPESAYASALTGLCELALSGCTTSADHMFAFPPSLGASVECVAATVAAASQIGMRIHVVRGAVDPGYRAAGHPGAALAESLDRLLKEMEEAIDRFHNPESGSMCRVALGADALSPEGEPLLRAVAAMTKRRGVLRHTHCSQVAGEVAYCEATYGCGPVQRLAELGWLDDQTWLAHAVHVTRPDRELLASAGVGVAHCPTSNMRLGAGLAPIASYLELGMRVGIGVDGSASNDAGNLLGEARQALLVSRLRGPDRMLDARTVLEMATTHGAAVLHRDDLGVLSPGRRADIALYRQSGVAAAGAANDPAAALVLTWPPRATHVLVEGSWVVRDGSLVNVEEAWVAEKLSSAMATLTDRAARRRRGKTGSRTGRGDVSWEPELHEVEL